MPWRVLVTTSYRAITRVVALGVPVAGVPEAGVTVGHRFTGGLLPPALADAKGAAGADATSSAAAAARPATMDDTAACFDWIALVTRRASKRELSLADIFGRLAVGWGTGSGSASVGGVGGRSSGSASEASHADADATASHDRSQLSASETVESDAAVRSLTAGLGPRGSASAVLSLCGGTCSAV